ncbi:MAG: hypothetical protein H7Z14_03145 [Anaerolineae bacterium]|nr:hypothetical protein [Phycisphaerae bacterium]
MKLRDNASLDRMPERRRRRPNEEETAAARALVLARADFLLPDDRQFIRLAFENNLTHRQLAELFAIPAGTVCRRIRRAVARLCDPLVTALLAKSNPLPPEYRQLAIEHWLQGLTRTELCHKHQLPMAQVHRMLEFVQGWHRATQAPVKARFAHV